MSKKDLTSISDNDIMHIKDYKFDLQSKITKTSDESRVAFGLFSVTKISDELVKDREEDKIKTESLETSVYKYVRTSRDASVNHKTLGVGELVETMVFTKEKVEALKKALTEAGIPHTIEIGAEFWWGGHYVKDDDVWEGVKNGDYESWSIGGTATRISENG